MKKLLVLFCLISTVAHSQSVLLNRFGGNVDATNIVAFKGVVFSETEPAFFINGLPVFAFRQDSATRAIYIGAMQGQAVDWDAVTIDVRGFDVGNNDPRFTIAANNLGNQDTGFRFRMNGTPLTFLETWNPNASRMVFYLNGDSAPILTLGTNGQVLRLQGSPIIASNTPALSALWGTKRVSHTGSVGAGGGMSGFGDSMAITGTQSAVAPTATEGATQNYLSGAVAGNDVGLSGNLVSRTSRNIVLWCPVKIQESTAVRYWIGVTDQTLTTMAGADNPAGNYACFRFSTGAPDTNWKCVTKDNTTQNVTDSGIAANTTRRWLAIEFNDSVPNVKFYIDGALVQTHTANLPTTATNVRFIYGGETTEAVAKNIRFEYNVMISDL